MYQQFDTSITDCSVCCDNIDDNNFVLYKDQKESKWKSSNFCAQCIKHMLTTSWGIYVNKIEKADCAEALRRAVNTGPPINFRDTGLVCDNESKEVESFYYENGIQSAKLEGSLTGEERDKWWEKLKSEIKRMDELEKA